MLVLFSVGCDDNVMVCSRLGQNKIIDTHMNYVQSWAALDYESGGGMHIHMACLGTLVTVTPLHLFSTLSVMERSSLISTSPAIFVLGHDMVVVLALVISSLFSVAAANNSRVAD